MKILRHYSSLPSLRGLYILSAVRTPIGLLNGALSELTAPQLGSFAIKESMQRAAVPPVDVENVFLECVSHSECHEEIIRRTGLSKATKVSLFKTCRMASLSEAVKFLLKSNGKVCIAGGMESVSKGADNTSFPNFIKTAQEDARKLIKSSLVNMEERKKFEEQNYNNFVEATKNGAFSGEIVKIDFKRKGQQILVVEDEILRENNILEEGYASTPGDGATAMILSTEDYVKVNHLVPLAKVISYAEGIISTDDLASAQLLAIEKALEGANCKCDDLARWEMVSVINDTIIKCRNYLNINSSQLNKDGGILSLGFPTGMSGVRAICHLVHSLSAGEMGCVASCDFRTASAIVVQKMGARRSIKPQLTLYTRQSCTLCEELKEQLKAFRGRFSLVEVDIEGRDGYRYRELYQYDIPILFMDGVFLCKHRLDTQDLIRRLQANEASV